ncbi:MAG: hypothetical protein G01um101472_640 [Parcubacteria group bacterium Gr01-1014_72]|nr:MAG: hypothetical protein G01um101472_640 [Parcubacteria group bacterium Gr01-1014_72]
MAEKKIATVTHWYDKLGVAVLNLTGALSVGDRVKVKRGGEEHEDTVASIQIDHKDVPSAAKGKDVAVKLGEKTKEGAEVFKLE